MLKQIYKFVAGFCLVWKGTEQILKPTPSQPSLLRLERQVIIDSVCVRVCVCLLNV